MDTLQAAPAFAFQWHITDACDQRCEHCYIFSDAGDFSPTEMRLDDMRRVLVNCLSMCEQMNRRPYFYITGGDPILHKDFWALTEILLEHRVPFGILGNPFHLNEQVCGWLKSRGCTKYQLSIDGLRETHDAIRKPGSFDATLRAIPYIRGAGMHCAIMTTVSGTNMAEIPGIIDLVVQHQADVFAFGRYCATSLERDTHMAPEQYRDLLDVCWTRFERYKDSGTTFNLKDHLWTLYLHEKGLFKIQDGLSDSVIYDGCNCGRNHMTILPNGDVYACRRMESRIGNTLTDSVFELFNGPCMGKYRQYDRMEKCAKCELLRFCRGCPAVAYGQTHNPFAPDPQCWKEVV